jgi:uncharacterized membrane protein
MEGFMTDRGRTMVMVGSLVLNALLAGFVLGDLRGEAESRTAARHAQELQANMPSALETAIGAGFENERLTLADALQNTRDAQAAAAMIIRHDPLDLDRLDQEFARVRTGQETVIATMQRALRSAAAKLDPKGRDAIAELVEIGPPAGEDFARGYRWSFYRNLVK